MKTVRQMVSNRSVFTVERNASVQEAARSMAARNIGALSVMDGESMVGILSERDIMSRVIARGLDPASTTVASVMTTALVVADIDESYDSCLRKMKQANCRHLPVVDGERLLGIISLRDLLQIDITEKDSSIEILHHYMFQIAPSVEKKRTA